MRFAATVEGPGIGNETARSWTASWLNGVLKGYLLLGVKRGTGRKAEAKAAEEKGKERIPWISHRSTIGHPCLLRQLARLVLGLLLSDSGRHHRYQRPR